MSLGKHTRTQIPSEFSYANVNAFGPIRVHSNAMRRSLLDGKSAKQAVVSRLRGRPNWMSHSYGPLSCNRTLDRVYDDSCRLVRLFVRSFEHSKVQPRRQLRAEQTLHCFWISLPFWNDLFQRTERTNVTNGPTKVCTTSALRRTGVDFRLRRKLKLNSEQSKKEERSESLMTKMVALQTSLKSPHFGLRFAQVIVALKGAKVGANL